MSKKNLLQESDIRRMMKFANIGALSDTFVEKLNEASMYDEQETEEGMPPDEAHGRMPHGAAMDEMAEMPEADEAEHPGAEEPAGGEDDLDLDLEDEPTDDAPAGDVQGTLAGVQTVLKAMQAGFREMGMEEAADAIQVEMADEPEGPMDDVPEPELPTDDVDDVPEPEAAADDAGLGAGGEEPPEDPMEEGYADEAEEMEEGLEEEDLNEEEELEENDDLFNEVVRRVARRLMNK